MEASWRNGAPSPPTRRKPHWRSVALRSEISSPSTRFGRAASWTRPSSRRFTRSATTGQSSTTSTTSRTARDAFHLNLFAARNWFQIPNTYDQPGQDQRQKISTFNFAPGYQHTFGAKTVLTVNPFYRIDHVNYYPSGDPYNDTPATIAQNRTLTNWGVKADVSYASGRHNLKVGTQLMQTRLQRELLIWSDGSLLQSRLPRQQRRSAGASHHHQSGQLRQGRLCGEPEPASRIAALRLDARRQAVSVQRKQQYQPIRLLYSGLHQVRKSQIFRRACESIPITELSPTRARSLASDSPT